jgi:type I restriction enzyme S subunit
VTWESVAIRRIARVVNGGTPTPDAANWGGGVPWATPVDIGAANGVIEGTLRTLTEVGVATGSRMVPRNSILISTRAPIGYVARTGTPMAFNQGCKALVLSSRVDARFLSYQVSVLTDEMNRRGLGTTFVELSGENLGGIEVSLPDLEEQRRIADFLDTETARIDRLRSLTERQLALLAVRQSEIMREMTVGDTDLAATGVPWMPYVASSWRIGKVAQLFRTGSGTTPTATNDDYFNGDLPWVNSGDLNDGTVRRAARTISASAVREFTSLRRHPAGSLVVAMYGQGETKGRVGLLAMDAYVNQACCVLTPLGALSAEFAAYWFRAHKSGIVGLALGAGQPNLSQDLIRDLRVPVPDAETQRSVVARLGEAEVHAVTQGTLLNDRSRLLKERRQALITAAVTGRFDVGTARGADLS